MARTGARKKGAARSAIVVEMPDTETETPEKTSSERAADEVIETATEELPPQAEAVIFRTHPDTGKEAFLERVGASLISAEFLAREYGGGKYRVQFRGPDATGKMVYKKQQTFEVDPSVPSRPPRYARPQSAPVQNSDGTPAGGRMDAIIESGVLALFQQMQQSSQTQMTVLQSMVDSGKRTGPGVLEMITALTPLLAPLVTALVQRDTARKDPTEIAKELLEVMKGARAPTSPLNETVSAIRELLEVKDMLQPEAPAEKDAGTRLLEQLGPKVLEIIANAQSRGELPSHVRLPATLPVAAAAPALASGAAAPPQPEGDMSWKLMLAGYVPRLVKLAEAGKNAELYAEVTVDQFPENMKGRLKHFCEHVTIEEIIAAFPSLAPWQEWATEFFDAVHDIVIPPDDDEVDVEGDDGVEGGDGETQGEGTTPAAGDSGGNGASVTPAGASRPRARAN